MLRIGLIGTGAIGRTHMRRINEKLRGGRVVACADANLEFCQKVADDFGIQAYATGEELIASPDIDAIVVTTADDFHERYVLAAIAAGKYVFCEKPLAPTAQACQRIMAAEMESGKHLVQVGFTRRFDAGYRQLKQAIEARTYGEPLVLHCAHRNPDVAPTYDTPMTVVSTMIHEIDVIRWLLDEEYATVQMILPKSTRHTHEGLKDPQIMVLMTQSGVYVEVEAFVNTKHCYDIRCEVCCEDAFLNLPEPPSIQVTAGGRRGIAVYPDWASRFEEAYNTELQAWIDNYGSGKIDGPTAWDGYVAEVVADAAAKARETGEIVEITVGNCPEFYQKG